MRKKGGKGDGFTKDQFKRLFSSKLCPFSASTMVAWYRAFREVVVSLHSAPKQFSVYIVPIVWHFYSHCIAWLSFHFSPSGITLNKTLPQPAYWQL